MVESITLGLQKFAADPDFEVQERVGSFLITAAISVGFLTLYHIRLRTSFSFSVLSRRMSHLTSPSPRLTLATDSQTQVHRLLIP